MNWNRLLSAAGTGLLTTIILQLLFRWMAWFWDAGPYAISAVATFGSLVAFGGGIGLGFVVWDSMKRSEE